MKKPMISAIIFLTIVMLMASFGFSLDDTPPMVLPESMQGTALFVCPAQSSFWDSMATAFAPFHTYILIGFFFAMILLAFFWGWALYQSLLQDKFVQKDFKKPWDFTKLLFWAGIILLLVLNTPNHYRHVEIRGTSGQWVFCDNTSSGARPVSINLIDKK